jgi:CHRD domain
MEMAASKVVSRVTFGVAVSAIVALAAGCATYDRMMGKSVDLSGANEVPAVTTAASGTATIVVKDDHSVSGTVTVSGMAPTAAHIHHGATGKNGPIVIGLVKTSATTFKVPDGARFTGAQYAEYKAGNMYVNVHSAAHKGGEVRGQLHP